jgi:hypothetical protein
MILHKGDVGVIRHPEALLQCQPSGQAQAEAGDQPFQREARQPLEPARVNRTVGILVRSQRDLLAIRQCHLLVELGDQRHPLLWRARRGNQIAMIAARRRARQCTHRIAAQTIRH